MKNSFDTAELDQLITDYQRIAHTTVSRFTAKYTGSCNESEDLYAECMLVLMEHLNKSETLEEARHFHVMDMVHAMCVYILRRQTLSYPKGTSHFSAFIHHSTTAIEFSEAETFSSDVDQLNSIDGAIDLELFMESLTTEQREVMTRRLQGDSMRRISTETKTSYVHIKTVMKHVRKKYVSIKNDVL
ncbi:MAG: hypothetical protein MJZ85_11185 [Bacteroidales bacterium]|nr:hypothetical protein [Bacteroidales bacterium]